MSVRCFSLNSNVFLPPFSLYRCSVFINPAFGYIYDFLEIQQDFQDKIKSSLFTERIFKITVGFSILFDYVKYERCVHF